MSNFKKGDMAKVIGSTHPLLNYLVEIISELHVGNYNHNNKIIRTEIYVIQPYPDPDSIGSHLFEWGAMPKELAPIDGLKDEENREIDKVIDTLIKVD